MERAGRIRIRDTKPFVIRGDIIKIRLKNGEFVSSKVGEKIYETSYDYRHYDADGVESLYLMAEVAGVIS